MNTVASPQTPFLREAPDLQRLPPRLRSDRDRLVKDVLRAGRWFVGERELELTDADLAAIEQRFNEHTEAGIIHPLVWGHTPQGEKDVSESQAVADVDHVWVDGERLWIGIYVTPETAAKLSEKNRQCSVGLLWNWRDGTGKVWPGWSLLHVGIVAHAVVPDQHPFIEMAADTSPAKGKRMTFDIVKEEINKLLEAVKPGTSLPETLTEENADEMLPALIAVVLGKPQEEEPADDATDVADAAADAAAATSEMPMELSASIRSYFDQRFNALEKRVRGDQMQSAEQSYRNKVKAFGGAGVDPKALDGLIELGSANGWDTKVLETVAAFSGKTIELGSKLGSGKESKPATPGSLTPEEIEAAKKEMIGRLPGGGRRK